MEASTNNFPEETPQVLQAFLAFLDTTEKSGIVHLSGYTHWASTHSALTKFVNIYFY